MVVWDKLYCALGVTVSGENLKQVHPWGLGIPVDVTHDPDLAFEPDREECSATQVLNWLYIGGEDEVDSVLPKVDAWIDLRHFSYMNRRIYVPQQVTYLRFPFEDGNLDEARRVLPLAKCVLDKLKAEGKHVLVSCHAGVSRSALLALWMMAEEMGYEKAWCTLKALRPQVEIDKRFLPLLQEIEQVVDARRAKSG